MNISQGVVKLPRTTRLDQSDLYALPRAAPPGEWAVAAGFLFAETNQEALSGKERVAFAQAWLGVESFGFATFVTVAEADAAAVDGAVFALAAACVAHLGAPNAQAARAFAEDRIADAAALCQEHKINTLLAVERAVGTEGLIERFRVIRPDRARDHAQIWTIVPDDGDENNS